MDTKPSIFETAFKVRPGEGGTFLIETRGRDLGTDGTEWGFTDIADLIEFFQAEAEKLS